MPQRRPYSGSTDDFDAVLRRESRGVLDFSHAGAVLVAVLSYLEEQNVNLMQSEYEDVASTITAARACTCFVLSGRMRDEYSGQLAAYGQNVRALETYYEELYEEAAVPGIGAAMADGVAFLLSVLDGTSESTAAILIVS
ncbi:MAG: hypothetical protein ABW321_14850 [Polyangiales bacterium]